MSKIWLITGAGRGMGVDIAKAALAAGHKVVATGRNTDKVLIQFPVRKSRRAVSLQAQMRSARQNRWASTLQRQTNACRELSSSLAYDNS